MHSTRYFFLTLSVLLHTSAVYSQSSITEDTPDDLMEMSLEDLMGVTVSSATKKETKQIEVPQSISILTRAEIDRIPANNIGELVERLVGVNTVRIQSGQNVITTRGSNAFSPAKLLILIDGQAIDPTVFSTTWWELVPVSISMIERIEFIRSPGTIYGANAENGVVNIITRKIDGDAGAYQVDGGVRYGEQNLLKADLNLLGKVGKVSYRISTELYQVDAYENSSELAIPGQKINDHGEQAFTDDTELLNLQTVNLGMTVDFDESKLDIGIGYKHISRAQG